MFNALLENCPASGRPALAYLLNLGQQLLRLFPEAALLCGRARTGGRLRVLVTGDEADLAATADFIFSGRAHRLALGRIYIYAPGLVRAGLLARLDLAVANVPPVLRGLWRRRGYFLLPKWVGFSCDTAHCSEAFLRERETLGADIKKLEREGFTCELSRDPDAAEKYYSDIYLPYIVSRFGQQAHRRGGFTRPGPGCALLLVKQRGATAAGVFCVYGPGGFRLELAAPAPEHAPGGRCSGLAMTALYYYSLRRAKELGYARADFGGCRPFLNDGLFAYKRKWRMRVAPRPGLAPDHALKTLKLTSAVRAFLAATPFVFRDGDGLGGLVFLDSGEPASGEQVQDCRKRYLTAGLAKLRVASASGFCGAVAVPEGLALLSAGSPDELLPRGEKA